MEPTNVYRIPAVNYAGLLAELETLNKRARKLGVDAVSYRELSRETISRKIDGRTIQRTYITLEVNGGYPHLSGWHFVGIIEPTDAGNILKIVPGETVPELYRSASNNCDHCHTNRYRKATYIIRHDDGRFAQVGGNCLAAYVGSDKTPAKLAAMAEFIRDIRDIGENDDSWGFGSAHPLHVDTADFLATVAALSRHGGFVTRKHADINGGTPTSVMAWRLSYDAKLWQEMTADGFTVTDADIETAKAAIAHAQSLPGDSDFDHNLKVTASLSAIDHRQSGIAAYLIEAYRRATEAERVAKAPKPVSRFVGTVGKRETFRNLTVARIHEFETDYGVMRLFRFLDGDGNTLVWKTGTYADWLYDAEQTQEPICIKATVKAHETYRDRCQTILTRLSDCD